MLDNPLAICSNFPIICAMSIDKGGQKIPPGKGEEMTNYAKEKMMKRKRKRKTMVEGQIMQNWPVWARLVCRAIRGRFMSICIKTPEGGVR